MIRRLLGYLLAWLVLASGLGVAVFLTSSTTISVASHDTVVRPTLDGWATIRTGPLLPDLRLPAGSRVGVELTLGKTEAATSEELVERYALLGSRPETQVERVRDAVRGLAFDAALRGGVAALLPLGGWALIGARRRGELLRPPPGSRRWVAVGLAGALGAGVLAWQPWHGQQRLYAASESWRPLAEYADGADLPEELRDVEVTGSSTTDATHRLLTSAVESFAVSKTFYADATRAVAELELRQPGSDETVALMISDRHDNIGMDQVARAIADRAGATAVLNAGDDTSTGQEWETFSLDSLDAAFGDLDRWTVSGNHDHGGYVRRYLSGLGWVTARDEVVPGPGGSTLLAVDDPRSSGLGIWRDHPGLTVPELAQVIADEACSGERVNTLLVHDADMGTEALRRGCVDLVLSGHLHVQVGPDRVVGENGQTGWAYTNGTTGGAAYALAAGSKLRRAAMVTLVTYADGRPVGVQPVVLETNGKFQVGEYLPLDDGRVSASFAD